MQGIDSAEKKKHSRAVWAIGLVLAIMMITTVFAGWTTAQVARNSLKDFFNRQADQIASTFYTDMEKNVMILQGLRGLWNVERMFDYASFSTYVESLTSNQEHRTGFSAYFYATVLQKSLVEQKIAEVKKEKMIPDAYQNFEIKNSLNQDILYPLLYVVPTSGREGVIGLNFASLPLRREAIEYARDNNALATTESLTLQSTGEPGFLFFLPIYKDGIVPDQLGERRNGFAGVVGVAFRSAAVFEQIYGQEDPYPLLDFRIYHGESHDQDRLLYAHDPSFDTAEAMFSTTRIVRVQGQSWTVIVYAKPNLSTGYAETNLPLYVFVIGIFASIVTAIYFAIKLATHIKQDIQLVEGVRN